MSTKKIKYIYTYCGNCQQLKQCVGNVLRRYFWHSNFVFELYKRNSCHIYIYTLSFSNYMFITVILHYDIYTVKHNNFFYWLKGKDATVIIWTYLCGTTCVANGYTCRSTSHVDSTEPEYQRWETCLQSI